MSTLAPNITIPVDLTNPGQFFACCGLLELADRLWPGAEVAGWFQSEQFCIVTADRSNSRAELLETARTLKTWVDGVLDDPLQESDEDESEDSEKELPFQPFELRSPDQKVRMHLDWWSEKSLKPWAGSMKDRTILRAMLAAIRPQSERPFDDGQREETKTDQGKEARTLLLRSSSREQVAPARLRILSRHAQDGSRVLPGARSALLHRPATRPARRDRRCQSKPLHRLAQTR
jgi:hypothetical protein